MNWDKLRILMDKAGSEEEGGGGSGGKGKDSKGSEKDNSDDNDDEDEDSDSDDNDDEESDDDDDEEDEDDEEEVTLGKGKKKISLKRGDLKNAANFYQLLKDPEAAPKVIEIMARRAGLLEGSDTKKEIKKDAKSVIEILKEHLDEKSQWIADKLGPGIEAALKAHREELDASVSNVKASQVENQTEAALNRLSKDTNGNSRKFEQKMASLADKIKPGDGVSTYEYCQMLYAVASGNSNAQSASKKLADKLKKNASDAGSRLNGSNGGKGSLRTPNKTLDSRESAQAAFDKILGGGKD